jgi:hypothetical protein
LKVENCESVKWVLNDTLTSDEGSDFGYSVALSSDGKTIAVGAPLHNTTTVCEGACSISKLGEVGLVRLFHNTWDDNTKKQEWAQLGDDLKGFVLNGRFGHSVDMLNDDSYPTVVVGAPGGDNLKNGSVSIWEWDATKVHYCFNDNKFESESEYDRFGSAVAITGDVVVAGAYNATINNLIGAGYLKTLSYESNQWKETVDKLNGTEAGENFGSSLSIAFNKSNSVLRMAAGSPGYTDGSISKAGLASIYEFKNNEWSFMDEIVGTTTDDQYGNSLGLSGDAGLVLFGSVTGTDIYSWVYDEWRFLQDKISGSVKELAISDDGSLFAAFDGSGNVLTYVNQLPEDLQNACIPCVAVVDENDGSLGTTITQVTKQWEEFRQAYPNRKFCLLRPVPTEDSLFVPFEKATDALTIYHEVLRDDGDINKVSDWYDLCKFQKLFAFIFFQ